MNTDDDDHRLSECLSRFSRLFVLTGAGCSTASGLGDYRDKAGQWKRKQPITGQTFIGDELARKRYWARSFVGWPSFSKAQPSSSHKALQQLEERNLIATLVTQNVDQLHQKAGHKRVVDLHGRLSTVSCIDCGFEQSRDDYQQQLHAANRWLSALTADYAPDGDADLEIDNLSRLVVPPCPACDGLMKPDVVFFGENVGKSTVADCMDNLRSSDVLVVVGSSLMVYSGFRFCRDAQRRNQPIVIVNNGKTRADELALLKIEGDCGQRLQRLSKALQKS
ncbi:MAG: NAD-dependent protein deacetylase [Granulosicoccus sp.]